jgi:hypothetical protein
MTKLAALTLVPESGRGLQPEPEPEPEPCPKPPPRGAGGPVAVEAAAAAAAAAAATRGAQLRGDDGGGDGGGVDSPDVLAPLPLPSDSQEEAARAAALCAIAARREELLADVEGEGERAEKERLMGRLERWLVEEVGVGGTAQRWFDPAALIDFAWRRQLERAAPEEVYRLYVEAQTEDAKRSVIEQLGITLQAVATGQVSVGDQPTTHGAAAAMRGTGEPTAHSTQQHATQMLGLVAGEAWGVWRGWLGGTGGVGAWGGSSLRLPRWRRADHNCEVGEAGGG